MARRSDDNAGTVANRLIAYHDRTAPLIAYYKERSILDSVDAMQHIDKVADDMGGIMRELMDPRRGVSNSPRLQVAVFLGKI